ncbi:MAG: DUF4198 domain-containing protein [Vicinamibacterales bacterium]
MRWLLLAAVLVSQPATQSIQIWSEHPIAVDIEWLTIDEAGKPTVTARRETAIGPPVPLEFTPGVDRYVRFSYRGASPRTYSTAELIKARKLHVPNVLPGGELLLIVPRMTVRPAQLVIEGPRGRTLPLDGATHISLSGMTAGEYHIVPVYNGGFKGAVKTVAVLAAETTLLYVAPEAVGAVRVIAAPDVCDAATEMGLNTLVVPNVGAAFKGPPNRVRLISTRDPRCEMTFAGLGAGQFEVVYRRGGASTGSSAFEIVPQQVSIVDVAGTSVRVEGRATLNGKPIADASVTFAPRQTPNQQRPMQAAETKTDAEGYYSVPLEAAGTYSVMLRRARLGVPSSRLVEFVVGRNFHDFMLTGGTIKVELTGWDGRTSVQVRVQGPTSSISVTTFSTRGPLPPFEAMPFGTYKVSVLPGNARGSAISSTPPDAKTVIISASSPEATVSFQFPGR